MRPQKQIPAENLERALKALRAVADLCLPNDGKGPPYTVGFCMERYGQELNPVPTDALLQLLEELRTTWTSWPIYRMELTA